MNRFPRNEADFRFEVLPRWSCRVLLACLAPWPILVGAWGRFLGLKVIDTRIEVARGETDYSPSG